MPDLFSDIVDTIYNVGGDIFDTVEEKLTGLSWRDAVKTVGSFAQNAGDGGGKEASNPYTSALSYAKQQATGIPASARAKLSQSTPSKPMASTDPRDFYREWTQRLREFSYLEAEINKK